jgi:Sec-independent protein secretion pathway component TatC
MDRTNVLWFLGIVGVLAVFGLVLGAVIVPPDPFSQVFVGVQWLAFAAVLAYLIVFAGEES